MTMLYLPSRIWDIVTELHEAGAHCYLVGGYVRDYMCNAPSKDIDIEIHELEPEAVVNILSHYGKVDLVGESFGVYRLKGFDIDWSLPRREVSTGDGHRAFEVQVDPHIGIVNALRRRDFTINAMALSLKENRIIDPFRGDIDLHDRILRHVDAETFVEDPLRVLRGAQFCARFGLCASMETIVLCYKMRNQYSTLPRERVWEEWKKMLLKGGRPSLGLRFLYETKWLEHFPELAALFQTAQDLRHHPEGDVGIHTCQVIDRAADLLSDVAEKDRLVYMLACLLHDVGKPSTTEQDPETGYITAHGHDSAGVAPARTFLERLTNEADMVEKVLILVEKHMFPHYCMKAKAPAFRRLQKKVDGKLLGFVAQADGDKKDGSLDYYYRMLDSVGPMAPPEQQATVVQGRHLIARGMKPGPQFGAIIRECEEYFLETGIRDPEILLKHVLKESS